MCRVALRGEALSENSQHAWIPRGLWLLLPVQQLISSLVTIGTFISSLLVGPFSSKFGRRAGLWVASVLNAVATAIMLGTTSVGALYFARLLLGMPTFIHAP